jgi:hypothetical protein
MRPGMVVLRWDLVPRRHAISAILDGVDLGVRYIVVMEARLSPVKRRW